MYLSRILIIRVGGALITGLSDLALDLDTVSDLPLLLDDLVVLAIILDAPPPFITVSLSLIT